MKADDIAILLTASGFATVAVAFINWLATRKKTGADTAVVLSGEAREWAKQAIERAEAAETRLDAFRAQADNATERAKKAEESAKKCGAQVEALIEHIMVLEEIMKVHDMHPPEMPKL